MRNKSTIIKLIERVMIRSLSLENETLFNISAIARIPELVGEYGEGNCWGTTLWTLRAYEQPKFIGTDQMQLWLDRNTEKVSRPKLGDILVIHAKGDIWLREGTLSHTAIRIGNGLYWHQAGSHGNYKIGSLKEVMAQYPGTYSFVRRKQQFEVVGDWMQYGKSEAA